MSSISRPLWEPPSDHVRREIVQRMWGMPTEVLNIRDFDEYFKYYIRVCHLMHFGLHKAVYSVAAETHEHIVAIVECLRVLLSEAIPFKRANLRMRIRRSVFASRSDMHLNHSIDLALRLWLTLNMCDIAYAVTLPGTHPIQWDDTMTFADFVQKQVPHPKSARLCERDEGIQLDYNMTAANLCRIRGIEIVWTFSLQDHLKFHRMRRCLYVYPLKGFLQRIRAQPLCPIPQSLIDEIIWSLDILYPLFESQADQTSQSDAKLSPPTQPFPRDRVFSVCFDKLRLSRYKHLRDRLAYLHNEYHSPPQALSQLWADRRNPLQWYTFWFSCSVFFMTLVFGFISLVTTCLQTRYAYLSLQMAIKSQAGMPTANVSIDDGGQIPFYGLAGFG